LLGNKTNPLVRTKGQVPPEAWGYSQAES